MGLYVKVTPGFLKTAFRNANRDYFSYAACEQIINLYDDIGEEALLDVVELCGEFTEYGDGCALSFGNLIEDYDYVCDVSFLDWLDDCEIKDTDETREDYIENRLFPALEGYTYCVRLRNGNILLINI